MRSKDFTFIIKTNYPQPKHAKMTQVIRINKFGFIDKNHYGLVFTKGSNIKKYCEENNQDYDQCLNDNLIDIDMASVKNSRVSILEKYDNEGKRKQKIIYDCQPKKMLEDLKRQMETDAISFGKKYGEVIDEIKFHVSKHEILDGSSVYCLEYDEIINLDGENIKDSICESYTLIANIPIIDYH